jgi:hypothetical protein
MGRRRLPLRMAGGGAAPHADLAVGPGLAGKPFGDVVGVPIGPGHPFVAVGVNRLAERGIVAPHVGDRDDIAIFDEGQRRARIELRRPALIGAAAIVGRVHPHDRERLVDDRAFEGRTDDVDRDAGAVPDRHVAGRHPVAVIERRGIAAIVAGAGGPLRGAEGQSRRQRGYGKNRCGATERHSPHTRSITMAMPWPTPMHMAQSA